MKDLEIKTEKALGVKCPRCRHVHMCSGNFDHLCDRCCIVIIQDWPNCQYIPDIKASLEAQKKNFILKEDK